MRARKGNATPAGSAAILGLSVLAGAAGLGGTTPTAEAQSAPADDRAVGVATAALRRAFTPAIGGSHLPLITALRQLRDPAMAPFFERITGSEDWQLQVHGILGLAELSSGGVIDISLLGPVGSAAQESIIAFGIDEKRLDDDSRMGLIAWVGLEPWPRLMLLADLHPLDAEGRSQAAALAGHEDIRIATLATVMSAADQGNVDVQPILARLDELDPRAWLEAVSWIYEAARQFELPGFRTLITATLDDPRLQRSTRDAGLTALLRVAPRAGALEWESALSEATRYGRRVRLGIALLAAGATTVRAVQPELIDEYDSGERLITEIAAACRAERSGTGLVIAACAMLATSHADAMAWALARAREMPEDDAIRVYACALALLDKPSEDRAPNDSTIAGQAAARLLEHDPQAVLRRLSDAPDDSFNQELLLTSLFDFHDPRVSETLETLPRGTPSRADSFVLLLLARDRELGAADLQQLAFIAEGGGRLIPPLEVQAAWHYLRQVGALDQALEEILPAGG